MERREQVLESIIEILENTSNPSDNKTDQQIDAFLSLYTTANETDTVRFTFPTLSISNELTEIKSKIPEERLSATITNSFLKRGNPFPPTTSKVKDQSKVLRRRKELTCVSSMKTNKESKERSEQKDRILESMERPFHVQHMIRTNEGDSNTHRQDFQKILLGAIEKQNSNLNQTICQLCTSRITNFICELVRKSVIANKGVIRLEVSNFLKGARPTIVHSEETDHQLVEEQLKDFGSFKNDENSNEQQKTAVDPAVENVANFDKRSIPKTCMESMVEGSVSSIKMTVVKSSTCFKFDPKSVTSSEQINHLEKSFAFKGSVELDLNNQKIPTSFSTTGKLNVSFSDSSASYPKAIIMTLDIKSLYNDIIGGFSKSLKKVIIEKNKIRLENLQNAATQPVAVARSLLSSDKKRKSNVYTTARIDKHGLKRRSAVKIPAQGIYQKQLSHTAMSSRPPYSYPYFDQNSNHPGHRERRPSKQSMQSGLDSLGEAAEAVRLAEETMMLRENFKYQGRRPSAASLTIESQNQNFNREIYHYNDPYLKRESFSFNRQSYGSNDPYEFVEPRRLRRMSRRQSNDSIAAAIEAVYLAELEADRRQRASLHEAMRLLDTTSNLSSRANTMVAAAADAARFVETEEMRRQSFLSNDSNDFFDLVSRHRNRQYSVDSVSAPFLRRRSAGPESILSAAEAMRLAEMRRSSGGSGIGSSMRSAAELVRISEQQGLMRRSSGGRGIGSSMRSAAEQVRISEQQGLMNSQANHYTRIDANNYNGAYLSPFGGTNVNFPVNDMNQMNYIQSGAQHFATPMNYGQNAAKDREPMNNQQQVHFKNQMGI